MSLTMDVLRSTGDRLDVSYYGFADYRRRLAMDAAGIDLDAMKGFGGDRDWPPHHLQPLRYLLEHSDCDGWLHPHECEALAPVLRAFRPPSDWPTGMDRFHVGLTEIVVDVAENGGVIQFR